MNLNVLLIIVSLLLWSFGTDGALANLPFPADQIDRDTIDSQGEVPAASIPATYIARAYQSLNKSFVGQDIDFAQGAILQRDGSKMLSPEDAINQYGNGGLTHFDSPVSDDYAKFKSDQDAKARAASDTLARGGNSGAAKTWLGFTIAVIANFCDPISMAFCLAIAIFVKRWLIQLPLIIAWLSVQELLLSLLDDQYQTNAGIARITAGLVIIVGVALLKLAFGKEGQALSQF